jgi:predicted PurR-regulated permease PerM
MGGIAMTLRVSSLFFWLVVVGVFAAALYVLQGVILPFAAGLVVAYLFNPAVEGLVSFRFKRSLAAMTIVGIVLITLISIAAGVIPLLVQEASSLAQSLPLILDSAGQHVAEKFPTLAPYIIDTAGQDWTHLFESHVAQALNMGAGVAGGLVAGGQYALSFILFVTLMPVVAYFMMKEWPFMTHAVDGLWPRPAAPLVRSILREINTRVSGFIRGQLIVCLILASYYGLGLWLVGIQYGFLIGVLGGLLSLIPFVGSIFVLGASILVALFQMGDMGMMPLILAVSVVALGQFAEGNFITPRIVGDRVGLHPLWIIFALMAGGHLMGILGMLLAVPVAASCAVLIKYSILWYKHSAYYTGKLNSSS